MQAGCSDSAMARECAYQRTWVPCSCASSVSPRLAPASEASRLRWLTRPATSNLKQPRQRATLRHQSMSVNKNVVCVTCWTSLCCWASIGSSARIVCSAAAKGVTANRGASVDSRILEPNETVDGAVVGASAFRIWFDFNAATSSPVQSMSEFRSRTLSRLHNSHSSEASQLTLCRQRH